MVIAAIVFAAAAATPTSAGDLRTASGGRFSLPELVATGPVVLVFWNSWLPGADAFVTLIPEVEAAARRHGWPGAIVVFQEENSAVMAKLDAGKGRFVEVVDFHGELVRFFQVTKAPAVLLVERDGKVRARCGPEAVDVRALLETMADR